MIPHSQLAPLPLALPFRIISKTIGQGAYACIKKGAPPDAPKPVFAVKFINKDYSLKYGGLSKKQLDIEVSLHKHLGEHPHIVRFYDAGEDQAWRWIAMELAEGGDLFDKIESDVGVGEDIAHLYFLQLISAVTYMHRRGIGHRDIKPENILLSAEGDLKIADFGLATLFEYKGEKKLCTTSCGSPPYTAPEVVRCDHRVKKRIDEGYHGNLVDIWSCAVVLFVLLVGNTPWDEPLDRSYEFNQYINTTGRPDDELWHKLPEETLPLLRGMMRVEPDRRMSLDEIRNHAWVRRENPHLNNHGGIQNPVQVATQMFESMKIDFSQDPFASQRSHRAASGNDMDIDASGVDCTASASQPQTPSNDILFDRETRSSASKGVNGALHHQLDADEHLADEPACSQFASTPRVSISRTQWARKWNDILPSHSLTRFFSFWPTEKLRPVLCEALRKLDVSIGDSVEDEIPSMDHPMHSIKIRCLDDRNCFLSGSIDTGLIPGVEEHGLEINFTKAKGDPLEWRRLFKKVVVLCQEAVFRPEESTSLSSQSDIL